LADRGHLRHGVAYIDVRMKEDLDDRDAIERLRLDVLDVVDRRGQAALAGGHNAVGHLLRGEAVVSPDHGHDRNIDVGKDVGGHREDAEDAKDQNQERSDDKGVRPPQRKPDNPHHKAGTRSSTVVLVAFFAISQLFQRASAKADNKALAGNSL
jgi:hypothetical protein